MKVLVSAFFLFCTLFATQAYANVEPENWSCNDAIDASRLSYLEPHLESGSTRLDQRYGYRSHSRHRLDLFYRPNEPQRTPLVIFFHGGGFRQGDKCGVFTNPKFVAVMNFAFQERMAVAAVNYRLLYDAVAHPGVRKPLADGVHAVQWLKAVAGDYNLDKSRFVLVGRSAGAGIAAYIGFGGDRNDPNHSQKWRRESARVKGIMLIETQASYNAVAWEEHIFHRELVNESNESLQSLLNGTALMDRVKVVYGTNDEDVIFNPGPSDTQGRRIDMYALIGRGNEPSVYVENIDEDPSIDLENPHPGQLMHHMRHAQAIYEKAKAERFQSVTGFWGKGPVRRSVNFVEERKIWLRDLVRD